VNTDPNIDQILAQMRLSQADSQLPEDVRRYGFSVAKSPTAPLLLFALYSPSNTHDATFLANYAYINLNDKLLRVPGISQIRIFGAGQYAMRLWVRPDTLAKLNITVGEILSALQQQNAVNPAGQVGGEPAPKGQEFTYAVRAQGRLITAEEFGDIVIRANADGSIVRMKDVSRPELGAPPERAAVHPHRGIRRVCRAVDRPSRKQYLCPDRPDHAHRAVGKELHPHR